MLAIVALAMTASVEATLLLVVSNAVTVMKLAGVLLVIIAFFSSNVADAF